MARHAGRAAPASRRRAAAGAPALVGNIEAARAKVRTLPTQADYNRCWPGTGEPLRPEAEVMRQVVEIAREHAPFASIDIHNNTGNNPHYACVNRLDDPFLHLARLFGRTVVYFNKPVGVQSAALAEICPAVTVECGRIGAAAGVAHAADFVESCAGADAFPDHPLSEADIDLLQTFAIVKVPADATLSYDGSDADFRSARRPRSLELLGARCRHLVRLPRRCRRSRIRDRSGARLRCCQSYFDYSGPELRLARRAVPSMLDCR